MQYQIETHFASEILSGMKYLIQFSHSYFQFRIPELNSLLELNGLQPSDCYKM